MTHRVKNLSKFKQKTNDCGICSLATMVSQIEPDIRPEDLKKGLPRRIYADGMYTFDQAYALNFHGYPAKVYSANLDVVDFAWDGLSTKDLLPKVRLAIKSSGIPSAKAQLESMRDWLELDGEAKLKVTNNLPNAIRYEISRDKPVSVGIIWEALHKKQKQYKGKTTSTSDSTGIYTAHAVVIDGVSNKGVHVLDSLSAKAYMIEWDVFMTCICESRDIIVIG